MATEKMVDDYIREHQEYVENMTLEQARDAVAKRYSHRDMLCESDKAISMLLALADKEIANPLSDVCFENRKEQRKVTETMNSLLLPMIQHLNKDTADIVNTALHLLGSIPIKENDK